MQRPNASSGPQSFRQLLESGRWALRLSWQMHRGLVVAWVAASLAGGALPAALALVMRALINRAVAAAGSAEQWGSLVPWLALGLALTVLSTVVDTVTDYLEQVTADEVDLEINSRILRHAAGMDVALFEDLRFQDIIELAQANTSRHFTQLIANSLSVLSQLSQTLSLGAILMAIEPLGVLFAIPLAVMHLAVRWRLSRRKYLEEKGRAVKRRWSSYFVSLLTSRRTVAEARLLDLPPILIERFRTLMSEIRDQNRRIYQTELLGNSVFATLTAGALFGVLWSAYRRFVQGALSVGDLVTFGTVSLRLRGSLEGVVKSVNRANESALFTNNLRQFLEIQPSVDPQVGQRPIVLGGLELDKVTFTYPGSKRPVLRNLSLHIEPGHTVALVGRNGAGKTTLVKLLARFYDPDSGVIRLDGQDLRDLALQHLQAQIAFVFQNLSPYEATAAENIAFGDWRRLLNDRQEVERIARSTGVDEIVERMPQGYDTLLGRHFGEYDLSEGQWQQMAIARAFARNAPLLVLDEPSARLDAQAEYRLFQRFRQLAHGRTAIIISHRFSTVRMADRIFVLEAGELVEQGSHDELVARGGLYARLYGLQIEQLGVSVPAVDGSGDPE
jgi:ATP-binding cassette, subfamily B, bacterial